MSAYTDAIDALKNAALAAQTEYSAIDIGAMPIGDSLTLTVAGGRERAMELGGGCCMEVQAVINCRNTEQKTGLDTLYLIHRALCGRKSVLLGTGWQITRCETISAPLVIEHEESGKWLLGSSINVQIEFD